MGTRFYDKLGFQLIQQNQAFMRCRPDIKGIYFELRLMAGNSEHEDGTIPLGPHKKAKLDDVLDYLTDYDKSKRNYFNKALERLVAVGMLHIYPAGVVKLSLYEEEQALGRTPEVNRKRSKAELDLLEMVNEAGGLLKRLFRQSGAQGLPYELLAGHVRQEFSCYAPKAQEILSRMVKAGVLLVGDDGLCQLASLARPPGAGAGNAWAGAEFSGARKIPLESDPDSDPEGDTTVSPAGSAGQLGASPDDRGRSPGSRSPEPGAGGGRASEARPAAHDGRPPGPDPRFGSGSGDVLYSPEDAWSVRDPVHGAEVFLQQRAGFDEKSSFSIRSRWRKLREGLGPKVAEECWRSALHAIVEDWHDGKAWRSYTANFLSKLAAGEKLRLADLATGAASGSGGARG